MRSFNYFYRSWTAFLLILFSVTISANGPVHAKEQTNQASSEKATPSDNHRLFAEYRPRRRRLRPHLCADDGRRGQVQRSEFGRPAGRSVVV